MHQLLFIKDALNWPKVTAKAFIMLLKISISDKCYSFELSIHLWILKKNQCITVSTKICISTTVFNIDNNQKCFLSSKSAYYYDFWRSCDTEDWSNDAENTAAHHSNQLQFTIYSNRKQLFLIIIIIFHNITDLLYFWPNKCSLGEQKISCVCFFVFLLLLSFFFFYLSHEKSHMRLIVILN